MKQRKSLRKDNIGYLFIAPFFIAFLIFSLYPIIYTLRLSFSTWDGISDPVDAGFSNYAKVLTDGVFWTSVGNTVIMTLAAGILQLIFGIVLAYVLNQKFIKGPNVFKNIFYFPNLVTAVSLGVLFSLLFDWQSGGVNRVLMSLGLVDSPVNWMASSFFSKALIIFILWFQYFGYYIIIFTAGIKGISNDLLEAAQIDGAGQWKIFTRIVLPLLTPVITYASITIIIGGMQIFDIPYVIGKTTGEPGNATLSAVNYLYNTSFKNYNYGYGAAMSYILFILIIVFSVLYMRRNMKEEY
ncbi:carbohydrate ABC transporter permease [Massiliimalia timonensis]|uniref:carbohydrate ABC transporter permease n=1 Tax=Massiliimalia timonensis TaxID=1987501 RepID=UPI001E637791|nr:sugar ABC transporter permease [Massiliimalia timonensis]